MLKQKINWCHFTWLSTYLHSISIWHFWKISSIVLKWWISSTIIVFCLINMNISVGFYHRRHCHQYQTLFFALQICHTFQYHKGLSWEVQSHFFGEKWMLCSLKKWMKGLKKTLISYLTRYLEYSHCILLEYSHTRHNKNSPFLKRFDYFRKNMLVHYCPALLVEHFDLHYWLHTNYWILQLDLMPHEVLYLANKEEEVKLVYVLFTVKYFLHSTLVHWGCLITCNKSNNLGSS